MGVILFTDRNFLNKNPRHKREEVRRGWCWSGAGLETRIQYYKIKGKIITIKQA